MSIIIRRGTPEDLDALEALYGEVCDHMAATVNYTGWKRDVYPARQNAEAGIREGTLFLAEEDGQAAVRVRRIPVRGRREPGAGGHRPGPVPAV